MRYFYHHFWIFFIVFDHANACASMHSLVEIYNTHMWFMSNCFAWLVKVLLCTFFKSFLVSFSWFFYSFSITSTVLLALATRPLEAMKSRTPRESSSSIMLMTFWLVLPLQLVSVSSAYVNAFECFSHCSRSAPYISKIMGLRIYFEI